MKRPASCQICGKSIPSKVLQAIKMSSPSVTFFRMLEGEAVGFMHNACIKQA
jgi:hypothetical protein